MQNEIIDTRMFYYFDGNLIESCNLFNDIGVEIDLVGYYILQNILIVLQPRHILA